MVEKLLGFRECVAKVKAGGKLMGMLLDLSYNTMMSDKGM